MERPECSDPSNVSALGQDEEDAMPV